MPSDARPMLHLNIRDYVHGTVEDLANDLRARMNRGEGARLRDLRFWDVTHDGDEPIADECGIYWVALHGTPLYIGTCTSLSFVERLGGHLSLGSHHWKNLLLRRYARIPSRTGLVPRGAVEQVAEARLGLLHIMRRGMPGDIDPDVVGEACRQVGRLEKVLRGFLQPALTPAPDPDEQAVLRPIYESLSSALLLATMPEV